MLTAPLKWLVQATALLPDALRPGVFLAVIVLILWFTLRQRGLPSLWAAACRGVARVVDRAVGLAVLPQYLVANARQRRGGHAVGAPTADTTLVLSDLADKVLDGAASLYESHQREPMAWRRPPWKTCLLIVGLSAGAWIAMDQLPVDSEAKSELAGAYDNWRDLEDWADVSPDRRAEPGLTSPPRPAIVRVRRTGRRVGVRLRCREADRCRGRLVIRSASGGRLHRRPVTVSGGSTKLLRISVRVGHPRALRGSRVVMLRARRP